VDTLNQLDGTIPHAWVGEPDSGIRLPWTFALQDLVDDDEDEEENDGDAPNFAILEESLAV
jgi:hypothetical protein